ncbi:fluoride efflux transporter CrcB [Bacillus sp. AFS076308]|uniref:fluoride efflux transporter CrcB n=1 Tax=unclassified Bacillus (in: firmicutes) TaxID=185979 RepID=UPI000BF84F5C|nr:MULTISPECIES: fluoride efflux transporter CrcB [unclassified Bacillus (in: firmicutes)]PFO08502.1 fluoride efflux transporter CrcB [Bacillus sp. AFS076308]PGV54685.1 fluoride efflux transporter CrcB [Bacillus sp. AFS037270]
MNLLAVGIGGFFGAIFRYLIGKIIPVPSGFPLGTLVINLLGCLFLSWFFTNTLKRRNINPILKLAIGTGFTGAFTTFSTFSVETLNLVKNHQITMAIIYVVLSILGGITLALFGAKLAEFKSENQRKGEEK